MNSADDRAVGREVLHLAVPAFITLIAEPLFLLADTAIVGHLGTGALAGLGVASTVLGTAVGLFVFLAYATTALTARRLGAGDRAAAVAAGLDGLWLSLILGLGTALVLGFGAPWLVAAFGAGTATAAQAVVYLRISSLGIPAMLAILALSGVLRGMKDTRTPLVAATIGFAVNLGLNAAFVLGLGMGIAGSAWGTVLAQTGMALGLLAVVLGRARRARARLRPNPRAILRSAGDGVPLLVRTLALRGVILTTTWVAAHFGDVTLAAHQVAWTLWSALAFALDALAIAGQALIGEALGASDVGRARHLTRLMTRWSVGFGVLLAVVIAATSPLLPMLFTSDDRVRGALTIGLLVVALGQPVAAHAFLLDGVLIGAGDAPWLARAGVALLVGYLPIAAVIASASTPIGAAGDGLALAAIWGGFLVFMVARAATLAHRARGDAWLVTGAR